MIEQIIRAIAHGHQLNERGDAAIRALGRAIRAYEAKQEAIREATDAALDCLDALDIELDEEEVEDEPEKPSAEAQDWVEEDKSETDEEDWVEEDEEDEEKSIDLDPIEMAKPEDEFEPVSTKDGLPVYGIGQMPKRLITRSDLAASAGLSPSGLSWHIKHHPEHPKPVAMLLTAGGGIPSLLFDRATTNTYWQTRKEH